MNLKRIMATFLCALTFFCSAFSFSVHADVNSTTHEQNVVTQPESGLLYGSVSTNIAKVLKTFRSFSGYKTVSGKKYNMSGCVFSRSSNEIDAEFQINEYFDGIQVTTKYQLYYKFSNGCGAAASQSYDKTGKRIAEGNYSFEIIGSKVDVHAFLNYEYIKNGKKIVAYEDRKYALTFSGSTVSGSGTGTKTSYTQGASDNVITSTSCKVAISFQMPQSIIYKLILSANGKTFKTVSKSSTNNSSQIITIPKDVPTKSGYKFLYWNVKSDGSGIVFNPGSEITVYNNNGNTERTIYAIWVKNGYIRLNLYGNGGNVNSKTIFKKDYKVTNGKVQLPTGLTLKRSGYTFVGWNTRPDGSGTTFKPGSNATANNLVQRNFYAVWKKNK